MTTNLPATKAEARVAGANKYFTSKPCKHGHLEYRWVANGQCRMCLIIRNRRYPRKTYRRALTEAGKQRMRAYYRKRRAADPAYRHSIPDPEKMRVYRKRWLAKHPEAGPYHCAMRYARKLRATPAWVDKAELRRIYERCPDGHEVDHIVPLKGENVCGLHVPWNLQYLTRAENASKNNRHE